MPEPTTAARIASVRDQLADLTVDKVLSSKPEVIQQALDEIRAVVGLAHEAAAPALPLTASEAVLGFASWLTDDVSALAQTFLETQHLGTPRENWPAILVPQPEQAIEVTPVDVLPVPIAEPPITDRADPSAAVADVL